VRFERSGGEDYLHFKNVQINVSYSNSVYELKQEASKMKTIILAAILIFLFPLSKAVNPTFNLKAKNFTITDSIVEFE
jgi:hypothetical protein